MADDTEPLNVRVYKQLRSFGDAADNSIRDVVGDRAYRALSQGAHFLAPPTPDGQALGEAIRQGNYGQGALQALGDTASLAGTVIPFPANRAGLAAAGPALANALRSGGRNIDESFQKRLVDKVFEERIGKVEGGLEKFQGNFHKNVAKAEDFLLAKAGNPSFISDEQRLAFLVGQAGVEMSPQIVHKLGPIGESLANEVVLWHAKSQIHPDNKTVRGFMEIEASNAAERFKLFLRRLADR